MNPDARQGDLHGRPTAEPADVLGHPYISIGLTEFSP